MYSTPACRVQVEIFVSIREYMHKRWISKVNPYIEYNYEFRSFISSFNLLFSNQTHPDASSSSQFTVLLHLTQESN